MSIYIPMNLTRSDYDKNLGGWRCPALGIPGAQLSSVRVDSEKMDEDRFPYDDTTGVIRCMIEPVPKTAVAVVELQLELTSVEDAKLEIEREKLRVEQAMHHEKLESERRWKIIAAVAPLVAIVLTALVSAGASEYQGNSADRQSGDAGGEPTKTQPPTALGEKAAILDSCRSKIRDEDRHLRNNDLNTVEDLRRALTGVISICETPIKQVLIEAAKE